MHTEIEIFRDLHCTWYILPMRTHPGLKTLGKGLLVLGTLTTCFMVFWMWNPVANGIKFLLDGQYFGAFMLGFGFLGLLGLFPSLGLLVLGAGLVAGRTHSRVGLMDDGIQSREYVGPLYWTWKRSAKQISEIHGLKNPEMFHGGGSGRKKINLQMLNDLVYVGAGCFGKKRGVPLVVGYPYNLASEIAREVETHLNRCAGRYGSSLENLSTRWVEGDENLHREVSPPENTCVIKEQHGDDITFIIPPAGLMKGSKGLFVFAILWNLFMTFFTALSIKGILGESSGGVIALLCFLGLFWAIGVGLIIGALNMGRRQAAIKAAGGMLYLLRQGLGKPTERSWAFHELEQVCMGDSGMEVNDCPVKELQIIPKTGKKVGCLAQLTDPEIAWIAYELRKAVFRSS